jgi:hypothetical protein
MPTLVGFNTFAALPEEQISERRILSGDQGMIVWWSVGTASMSRHTVTQMSRSYGCSRAGWSFASAANSGSAAQGEVASFRVFAAEVTVSPLVLLMPSL